MAKDRKDEGEVIAAHGPEVREDVPAPIDELHDNPHPVEPPPRGGYAVIPGDEEIEARQRKIADLERELLEHQQAERRKLVESERKIVLENLDAREEELKAQLARVRGEDRPEE